MDINPPSISVFKMGTVRKILFGFYFAGLILVILIIVLALIFATLSTSDWLILITMLVLVGSGIYGAYGDRYRGSRVTGTQRVSSERWPLTFGSRRPVKLKFPESFISFRLKSVFLFGLER